MKKIEAIIRPGKVDAVRQALNIEGIVGIMLSQVEGHGIQNGIEQQWRGEKYKIELLPKTKIEIVVKDNKVESIVNTIIKSARTGEIGDGKIFIYTVDDAIRIRTGERGEVAI